MCPVFFAVETFDAAVTRCKPARTRLAGLGRAVGVDVFRSTAAADALKDMAGINGFSAFAAVTISHQSQRFLTVPVADYLFERVFGNIDFGLAVNLTPHAARGIKHYHGFVGSLGDADGQGQSADGGADSGTEHSVERVWVHGGLWYFRKEAGKGKKAKKVKKAADKAVAVNLLTALSRTEAVSRVCLSYCILVYPQCFCCLLFAFQAGISVLLWFLFCILRQAAVQSNRFVFARRLCLVAVSEQYAERRLSEKRLKNRCETGGAHHMLMVRECRWMLRASMEGERVDVSIIVPVLNENRSGQLAGLLAHLQALLLCGDGSGGAACAAGGRPLAIEVLVADGGSSDGSADVLQQWARQCCAADGVALVKVLHSSRGRAVQMHTGALAARGTVLLFLHADTRLPDGAPELVFHELLRRQKAWGRFDVLITGRAPALRLIAGMMNLRSRLTGVATGDQVMFVSRCAYDDAGGFPQQPLMEDVALSKRLKSIAGSPLCLRQRVQTSGRRWLRYGIWRTVWLMWRLRWLYWRGHSAEELARMWSQ